MKNVNEQLLATIPEEKWLPIPYWKDAQTKWLPLFSIPDADDNIGVARSGEWFAISDNGYIQELTAPFTVQLLVLLHEPLAEATSLITTGVKNSGLPEDIAQVVINATMLTGLVGPDFWQNLSLNWLAEIKHVDDDILAVLEKVATDGRTQQVRHRARRILKSFYKSDI